MFVYTMMRKNDEECMSISRMRENDQECLPMPMVTDNYVRMYVKSRITQECMFISRITESYVRMQVNIWDKRELCTNACQYLG